MITPKSGSITIQSQTQTFDGIWLSFIQINAPSVTGKINASIHAVPFNSSNGSMAPSLAKTITINDIASASLSSPEIGTAMTSLINAIQGQIISKSLF